MWKTDALKIETGSKENGSEKIHDFCSKNNAKLIHICCQK